MKGFIFKTFAIFSVLPALAAGIFLCGGAGAKLPRGTCVCGVDVGGLTRARAIGGIRGEIAADIDRHPLTVTCGGREYVYGYPEVNFKDDLRAVLSSVRRAGAYGAHIGYYMNGLDEVVSGICAAEYREVYAPSAIFNPGDGQAFCYEEGADGAAPCGGELKRDILSALSQRSVGGAFAPVRLAVERVPHGGSMAQLKKRTARLSAYTTYFDGANVPRSANIKLAAGKISGCVLPAGATFSFNGAVGARTEERGYRSAFVIMEGQYVEGVGGGVCQVSGTLYNCALLADLAITCVHPHSLPVSYVAPSFDAMVSSASDLRFANTLSAPVTLRMTADGKYLKAEIYGVKGEFDIRRRSETLRNIPKEVEYLPDPALPLGEERVDTWGRDGLVSEGWLEYFADGELVRTLRIRRDTYKPQNRIVMVGSSPHPPQETQFDGAPASAPADRQD